MKHGVTGTDTRRDPSSSIRNIQETGQYFVMGLMCESDQTILVGEGQICRRILSPITIQRGLTRSMNSTETGATKETRTRIVWCQ